MFYTEWNSIYSVFGMLGIEIKFVYSLLQCVKKSRSIVCKTCLYKVKIKKI